MELLFKIIIVILVLLLNVLFSFAFKSVFILPRTQLVYWSINILLGIILLRDYSWSYTSFIYMMAVSIAFACGYLVIKEGKVSCKNRIFKTNLYRRILFISIILGIIYPLLQVYNYGFSIISIMSLNGLLEINSSIASVRYNDSYTPSLMNQIFLIFVHLSALLGGYEYIISERTQDKRLAVLSLLPSIMTVLVLNTKAILIVAILFYISSMIVAYRSKYKKYFSVNLKTAGRYLLVFSLVVIFLLVSMMFRIGSFDLDTYYIALDKLASYLVGHMGAFDFWFSNSAYNSELHFGTMTFMSISSLLGLETRVQGLYTDNFYFDNITTNVYTAFRSLILDFGIVGSIIVYFALGIILHQCICFMKSKNKHLMVLGSVSIIAFYSYLGWSFVTSIFTYLSYVAAYVLLYLILIFSYGHLEGERHEEI